MSRRCIGVRMAAVLVIAAATVAGCSTHPARTAGTGSTGSDVIGETYIPPAQRKAVPALSGDTIVGSHYALRNVRGRVVVVNVWASWCVECRKESRGLGRLSAALRASRVSFVGIDEHDTNGSARTFAVAAGTTYPQLADPRGALLARLTLLPSLGIPSTLVIDRHGRMAGRIIGAADETALKKLIERIAADH